MPRRHQSKRGSRYYRVRSSLSLARALPPTAPHRIDGPAPGRAASPMQRRLLRASISPMNVRPFSVSRKQSRRLPSWLTTPSKHHPDGPSHRAACSVLRATYVPHESCDMHRCSMQHTTVQHAAYTMPHRPFDTQHDLCMHSAPCNPRQGTTPGRMHDMRHGVSTGRPKWSGHASPAAGPAPARQGHRRRPRQPRASRPP